MLRSVATPPASTTRRRFDALYSNTTGGSNTATGVEALASNTTGDCNTANGYSRSIATPPAGYNTAAALLRSLATPPAAKTRPRVIVAVLQHHRQLQHGHWRTRAHGNTTGGNNIGLGT